MKRALLLVALAALAAALFVAASLTGRGARSAVGTAGEARGSAGRVVYYDGGSGREVVVLLASWARPASDFNELARALDRAGFRTLAVESRGIGGSDGGGPLPESLTRALFVSSLSFLPWSLREPELRRAFFARQSEIPDHWRRGWCLWGGLAQDTAVRSARPADF